MPEEELNGSQWPVCEPDEHGHCAICADEGVAGRVLELLPHALARVALPDGEREVALDLLDGIGVGDHILVHAGVGIARLEGEYSVE